MTVYFSSSFFSKIDFFINNSKKSPKGFSASKCDVGNWIFPKFQKYVEKLFGIFLDFGGNFREFFRRIFWEEFFWEKFLGGFFWEDFFGRIFLGGILWEELLSRN